MYMYMRRLPTLTRVSVNREVADVLGQAVVVESNVSHVGKESRTEEIMG